MRLRVLRHRRMQQLSNYFGAGWFGLSATSCKYLHIGVPPAAGGKVRQLQAR